MFTIAVLDSDAFCCKGIADYFDANSIRTLSCPELAELEYTLRTKVVQVVIAELATDRDTFFNCIAYLTQLTQRWPHIRLIIFTRIADPVMMKYVLLHVPHCNIVTKNDSLTQLASCVFAGANGHPFNSSSQAKLWKYLPGDRKTLSPHEFRLLELLARGKNNQFIARIALLNNKTISSHKLNIMRKLGCCNLAELHGKLVELGMLLSR